ncbi:MAG: phosphatase PAP2 family protein [Nocardioidaceae bacterium]
MTEQTDQAPVTPRRRWRWRHTRPITSVLLLTGGLAAAFAIYTWLLVDWGPMGSVDLALDRDYPIQSLLPWLHALDRIGQRAVCLPILGLVIAVVSWRHRAARPLLVGAVGVVAINLVVLILKVWLGRGAPLENQPAFFVNGQMYPSGHTANIIVVYGTCVYLLSHYAHPSRRTRWILVGVVSFLSTVMLCTSLLLQWHWFSDLVGGYLIGGVVLAVTVGIDAAVPFRSHRLIVTTPGQTARAAALDSSAQAAHDESAAPVADRPSSH